MGAKAAAALGAERPADNLVTPLEPLGAWYAGLGGLPLFDRVARVRRRRVRLCRDEYGGSEQSRRAGKLSPGVQRPPTPRACAGASSIGHPAPAPAVRSLGAEP